MSTPSNPAALMAWNLARTVSPGAMPILMPFLKRGAAGAAKEGEAANERPAAAEVWRKVRREVMGGLGRGAARYHSVQGGFPSAGPVPRPPVGKGQPDVSVFRANVVSARPPTRPDRPPLPRGDGRGPNA